MTAGAMQRYRDLLPEYESLMAQLQEVYAGPLTETVLMGNVAAFYPGEELKWDAKKMTFTNKPEADMHIRKPYRAGWEVKGLG